MSPSPTDLGKTLAGEARYGRRMLKQHGLRFALLFIALLLPHFRVPRRLLAVCFGAALSLFFAVVGAGQWNVMLATACAASIAAFWPMKEARDKTHA